MAERRMFAKTIVDSDAFLEMSASAQALYFHLGMRADDDGFLNNPRKVQRMVGAADDDLKILIAKRFIIAFETGVIVIKHWRMHNYIRGDRYKETAYQEEKAKLAVKENGAYTLAAGIPSDNQLATTCLPDGNQLATQVRLGKVRLGKDSVVGARFTPPTLEEVQTYCTERANKVDPQRFIDFYESKGWLIGKNKMKDWKAAIRNWESRDKPAKPADYSDFGEWGTVANA